MVAEENKKAIEMINQRLDSMESKLPYYNQPHIENSIIERLDEHSPTPHNERRISTIVCDDDASMMIAMPNKRKRKKNMCPIYNG